MFQFIESERLPELLSNKIYNRSLKEYIEIIDEKQKQNEDDDDFYDRLSY